MLWTELIADVRAQIDCTDDEAYGWLLDRARVMNTVAGWYVKEAELIGTSPGAREMALPVDCMRTEAVAVDGRPYRRVTLSEMDALIAGYSTRSAYSDGVDQFGSNSIALNPVLTAPAVAVLRFLADVPDDRTGSPPFPLDFHSALAEGAIATGLARMDERFDSAGYFDARFVDATNRLRLRRNSHVGRGPIPLRVLT